VRRRSPVFVLACLIAVAAAIGLGVGAGALSRVGESNGAAPSGPLAIGAGSASAGPTTITIASPGSSASAAATSSPAGSPQPSGPPFASPSTTVRPAGSAPLTAKGFRLRSTVVPIGFPLPLSAKPHYGPAWHAPRVGAPLPYQSVRGVGKQGQLLRAHDGIDIQVRIGTPVLAAFSGVVIDPATKWRPWAPALYGYVVVIRSTESTSPGYYAINAHLAKLAVAIGETVTRGQIIGLTGITGDAAGTIPHLHFELRAPFFIDQTWGGVFRRLDVFDPLPSLRNAAPRVR
jgi:murein DD-endopeptidase MepM/ murein hydrolase activator NlpD